MSFVNSLHGYLRYLRLYGFYPVKIHKDHVESSNLYRVFSLVVCIGFLVLDTVFKYDMQFDSVYAIVSEVVGYMAILCATSAWILVAVHAKRTESVFDTFQRVDDVLLKYSLRPNYGKQRAYSLLWLFLGHSVIFIPASLEPISPFWFNISVHRFFMYQLYFFLVAIITTDFSFLVLCAGARLKVINNRMQSLAKMAENEKRKIPPFNMSTLGPTFTCSSCFQFIFHNRVSSELKDLRKCHFLLTRITSCIVSTYGVPIILMVLHHFYEFICLCYFTLASAYYEKQNLTFEHSFNLVKWAGMTLMMLLMLLAPFSFASEEGNATVDHINNLTIEVADADTLKQLELFAVQLNHKQNFTPLGFFNLNMSFFVGILGGVSTYLVILLQMNSSGSLYWLKNKQISQ